MPFPNKERHILYGKEEIMARQGLNTKPVLMLNADTSVLTTVSVKRAITLCMTGKAVCLLEKEGSARVHPDLDLKVPLIVQLRKYKVVPFRKIPLTRRNVLIRDEYICQYTGERLSEKNATIDHIFPKSRKGTPGHVWTNVVACSRKVNNMKGSRMPNECGLKLMGKPRTPTWEDLVLGTRPEWKEYIEKVRGGV